MRERDIEKYLVQQVRSRGGMCFKFTSPGCAGVPDRICFFPVGQIHFCELKTAGGRLSALQTMMFRQMEAYGFPVRVLWSKDDVDRALREWTE